MRNVHMSAIVLLMLSACGGGSDGSGGGEAVTLPVTSVPSVSPTSAPTPAPSVTATPAPTAVTGTGSIGTSGINPFATFDYQNGTAFPSKPTVNILDAVVRPGDAFAYVPVQLSASAPTSVIVELGTRNGSGDKYAVSGSDYETTNGSLVFRIGDPLVQTFKVPLKGIGDGEHFEVLLVSEPSGGKRGDGNGKISASTSATRTKEQSSGFRAPHRFKPKSVRFEMSGRNLKYSAQGGADSFASQLAHGRTQDGNQETGLYVDDSFAGIEKPIFASGDDIVLHSQQFSEAVVHDSRLFEHGAAVLSGHRTTASQIVYGQYEWVAKMPDRRESWPALWMISTNGWPPEIDVYEGFGYDASFDFNKHLTHALHGGKNNQRSFVMHGRYDASRTYGKSGFANEYHSYAVDIDKSYITWFVDGDEVFQSVNPFAGTEWYPIMNVAVKDGGSYDGGSGDMRIRSFKVYGN